MRYLILSYMKRPNGQMDEVVSLGKNLRTRDIQTAAVILDFRDLKVVKASMNDVTIPKDFNRIVNFYHQHYAHIINRLFQENGYEVVKEQSTTENKA